MFKVEKQHSAVATSQAAGAGLWLHLRCAGVCLALTTFRIDTILGRAAAAA